MNEQVEMLLVAISSILKDLKLNVFEKKLEEAIINPTEETVSEFIAEYDKWTGKNSFKKNRMISLGENISLMRVFIVSIRKDYTEDGYPEIIINEMPDDVNLKDNPYKNLHIRYVEEEDCARDFDRLNLALNS